jgi:Bacterial PH domain
MFFKSAVDSWVYALALSLPVALILGVVPVLAGAQAAAHHSTTVLLAVASLGLGAIAPLWLLFFTYYRIDSAILRIQAGPFTWAIPLDHIRSIRPSRSCVSSPALSLNRLQIDYGRQRSILVSPKDKTGFIQALGYQPADILNSH